VACRARLLSPQGGDITGWRGRGREICDVARGQQVTGRSRLGKHVSGGVSSTSCGQSFNQRRESPSKHGNRVPQRLEKRRHPIREKKGKKKFPTQKINVAQDSKRREHAKGSTGTTSRDSGEDSKSLVFRKKSWPQGADRRVRPRRKQSMRPNYLDSFSNGTDDEKKL